MHRDTSWNKIQNRPMGASKLGSPSPLVGFCRQEGPRRFKINPRPPQDRPETASRPSQTVTKPPQDVSRPPKFPKIFQETPGRLHDLPRMCPRRAQDPARRSRTSPKICLRLSPRSSKSSQDSQKTAQDRSRSAQELPTNCPREPRNHQMAHNPESLKKRPKLPKRT